MVRGFAMESQDKRMCKSECGFSGVTVDEDYFGDILNMFDFPMETLEGDGLAEDWASKLGPIPSEVFRADLPFQYPVINNINPQLNHEEEEKKLYPSQGSPNSVLESRNSSLNNKGVSIPVSTRSKRLRPTTNPWLHSHLIMIPNKDKKRKQNIMETKKLIEKSNVVGTKKCSHCEITKTPQWREGPMGPKTLCNACGVRYRSGRLYPEYRPAASPTFVPALHSNSHRKVIEMRQKAV